MNLSAEDEVKMSSMEQLVIVRHSHSRTQQNGNDGLSCPCLLLSFEFCRSLAGTIDSC